MKQISIDTIESRTQAQDIAIEWQYWAGKQNLSMGELIDWQGYFEKLGEKFDLTEEFKENGIL